MKRGIKWIVGIVAVAVIFATGGTWLYINVIRDDAPERLTLDTTDGSAPTAGQPAADSATDTGDVTGTWTVTDGSEAGYRVDEILFGQRAEGVGRTEEVTGQIEIDGSTVRTGSFTVDMASVESDESRRDGQFRGRIMDVATYPTSTFTLTEPIVLASVPGRGEKVTTKATGELTLRGTTKAITVDLEAERTGGSLRILGTIPIVFAEWSIPNPSGGPATTEDNGELEFLLVLSRA